MNISHIVTAEEDGLTLQQILRSVMQLSGREARNAKAQGGVAVNGAPFFSNQKVREGMVVTVSLEDYAEPICFASPCALEPVEVIYEDDALLAVYKPALLQCHPSPSAPGGSDTLEARVNAYLGRAAHPVHRLDAETTGIVLFAKLPYAQAHLQRQMQEGTFLKRYQAWVFGIPCPSSGIIDAPIDREHPDSFTRIVTSSGQPAVSKYETIKTVSLSNGGMLSLLSLSPLTGRTHQLRVHMTHIGCPLLGDARYFTPESARASQQLSLSYHQLSAVALSFVHPVTAKPVSLTHSPVFSFHPENMPDFS
ncbi:MAG: RluA family pseudouridine synthase [Clostridia bacterium]|nr:RluA family pseudouridine synthase [Clostridia bacterium]